MTTIVSTYPASGSTIANPQPTLSIIVNLEDPPVDPTDDIACTIWMSKTVSDASTDPAALTYTTSAFVGVEGTLTIAYQPSWPSLSQGLWYFEWLVDPVSPSSPNANVTLNNSFTVAFEPSATVISPVGGGFLQYLAGSNNVSHAWDFGSPDPTDYQTAYQLKVYLAASPFTSYYDSGKVTSGAEQAFSTIAAAQKNTLLEWSIEVWGKTDVKSIAPIAKGQFKLADPPTVSITAPTEGQAVTTGNASVTFTPTTVGGPTLKTLLASLWKGGIQVWSKTVTGTFTSGVSQNIADTNFALDNLSAYYYRVSVIDSNVLTSADAVRNFTTNYAVPPTPSGAVTVVTTAYDTAGYIAVTWPGTPRDADFLGWQIERRDNMVDPDTGSTVFTSPWNIIGRSYGITATVEYRDFLAPANYFHEYRIKQVALTFGSEVVSVSGITGTGAWVTNVSYWLFAGVNGDSGTMAGAKLYNIVGDSYTDEVERAEFIIIGRGRYSEKGTDLGVRGQLELHLRNGEGVTARLKRQALETFKQTYNRAYLRNPFGDIYLVSVGDMSISRIAGVGQSEFCDVTIPYVESVE